MARYQQSGGFGKWIALFLFLAVLVLIVGFKYQWFDWESTKEKIVGTGKEEITVTLPPVNFEWCRIQDLQDGSQILGWDNINKCCIQQWSIYDGCLLKDITIDRCYIGDVGTIHKWSRIDGYYLTPPTDYVKFLNGTNCQQLTYPGGSNQDINLQNNYQTI